MIPIEHGIKIYERNSKAGKHGNLAACDRIRCGLESRLVGCAPIPRIVRMQRRDTESMNLAEDDLDILHVVPSLSLRTGGPAVNVVGLSRALQQHGYTVKVVATDASSPVQGNA